MESPKVVLWCKVYLNLCQNQPLSTQGHGQPLPQNGRIGKKNKAQPKPETTLA